MTGAMELQPNDGLRSSLSIVGRFVEGIGKLAGNMSGDCSKKTIKLVARMPEAIGLEGFNHEKSPLLTAMFTAPRLVAILTQTLRRMLPKLFSHQLFGCGGLDDSRSG
ncbi:hypothetical protein B296_00020386 [Ensete ventricosum]|uniref:Uncharacterized protein n=1 Tax=Ensete ventricosum TaxID=4639 RepID=A0A427AWM4_ENSVE|nr:hypothetical protein B296_00020386 [Ensete ventricosum]